MRVVGVAVDDRIDGTGGRCPGARAGAYRRRWSPYQPAVGYAQQDARRAGAGGGARRSTRIRCKKIPDAKVSNDPWGSVRSDAPKNDATTKTPAAAKAKTKTGSTQN